MEIAPEEVEKLKKELKTAKKLLSELMDIYMISADEEGAYKKYSKYF